jgi:hypothetical protein
MQRIVGFFESKYLGAATIGGVSLATFSVSDVDALMHRHYRQG